MLKGSGLAAIDLDRIRDLLSGHVLPWAEALFAEATAAGAYIEWTVSGTGARIIGLAAGDKLHRKVTCDRTSGCACEFYRNCERYITISGTQISPGDYPSLCRQRCRNSTYCSMRFTRDSPTLRAARRRVNANSRRGW